jgi:hypothetical protein
MIHTYIHTYIWIELSNGVLEPSGRERESERERVRERERDLVPTRNY